MTVEMEQPFVWPKTPSLEPWGQAERKKEMRESVSHNSGPDKREQRTSARKLQEEVKKLFGIREKAKQEKIADPDAIEQTDERESDAEIARERSERLTGVRLWEQQRTVKVVEADDRNRYTIKA